MQNLSDISSDFYSAHAAQTAIRKVSIPPLRPTSIDQSIYSWMALPDLIAKLKTKRRDSFDEEADRLERLSVRFVVDTHHHLWFSFEGECGVTIPAHSDMVNDADVLSAGNLVFSDDYQTIIEITNKSGHYEPAFGSVVFLISSLFALESDPRFPVQIASEIKLVSYQKITIFNPEPIAEITLSKQELRNLLPLTLQSNISDLCPYIKQRRRDKVIIINQHSDEGLDSDEGSTDHSASDQENVFQDTVSNSHSSSFSQFTGGFFGAMAHSPNRPRKRALEPNMISAQSLPLTTTTSSSSSGQSNEIAPPTSPIGSPKKALTSTMQGLGVLTPVRSTPPRKRNSSSVENSFSI